MSSHRVIIAQASMIEGGRLHTVLGIAACLNKLGIVPEVLSYRYKFDPKKVLAQYDVDLRIRFRRLPYYFPLPTDLNIARFNLNLYHAGQNCDLLINNSNSLLFLPKMANMLTYVYYPRKARIASRLAKIRGSRSRRLRWWSCSGIYARALDRLYRHSKPIPGQAVISISEFSRDALVNAYPQLFGSVPIVNPPVNLGKFSTSDHERMPWVTSVGRFDAHKGQLRQIGLAAQLPELAFHIVGFVADKNYFEKCKSFVKEHQIRNVELHPMASFEDMVSLLKRSKYFLHTTIDEPFGITAIQAIAAGCVPICHDSGGQRETVCIDTLRYGDLEEAADIVRELEEQPSAQLKAIVEELQAHVKEYDEKVFAEKMMAILSERLALQ